MRIPFTVSIRIAVLLIVLRGSSLEAEDWPRFRGPNGSGVSSSTGLPVEFGPGKNVVWKVELPFSYSSPIVVGDRVFVTGFEDEKLLTFCLDRETGKILWQRGIVRERAAKITPSNGPATPTPVSDGEENVYVFFPDLGLISYAADGKERWRQPLGPFDNFYGMSSSPILAGDSVVLNCDQRRGSFLIAFDRSDGRVRWRVERPAMTESYTTPVVYTSEEGPAVVIVLGALQLDAYSVLSGERQWWYSRTGVVPAVSPIVHGNELFVSVPDQAAELPPPFSHFLDAYDSDQDGRLSFDEGRGKEAMFDRSFGFADRDKSGFIEAEEWSTFMESMQTDHYGAIAVRLPAKGELPSTHERWRHRKSLPFISSPLLYKEVLYLVRDGGIVTSLDSSTGEVLKRGRATGALGTYFSSPVAADDKVFLIDEEGKAAVLKAGPEWEVLKVNDLGEDCYATPAIADGRIYIRTRSTLYCFGKTTPVTEMLH
jgi:outer membrane protein assembly factor BamB